ncbi:MAG: SGNH/GDSL hydrolase family protein [Planctomycetaceae bacterium]
MNPVVVHVASGESFFTGLALLALASLLLRSMRRSLRRFAPLAIVVGIIAIALSSTPIPYGAYGLLAAAAGFVVVAQWNERWRTAAAAGLVGSCLLCAGLEIPYHVMPALQPVAQRSLAVIGDSVTAGGGIENREITWPQFFMQQRHIRVQNLSHVGETAASALKRVGQQTVDAPLVLVEIGGNDVLGTTTARQFEQDLDALLAHLSHPGRQVVMFELPLPPFYHEFGSAQRTSARRHHVALVPKRVFLGLLAGDGATLDSVHLSQVGHQGWRPSSGN